MESTTLFCEYDNTNSAMCQFLDIPCKQSIEISQYYLFDPTTYILPFGSLIQEQDRSPVQSYCFENFDTFYDCRNSNIGTPITPSPKLPALLEELYDNYYVCPQMDDSFPGTNTQGINLGFNPNITEEIYQQNGFCEDIMTCGLSENPSNNSPSKHIVKKRQICYCGKTVLQKNFHAHLKTHEKNRKRLDCIVTGCNNTYIYQKDLKRHMQLKH